MHRFANPTRFLNVANAILPWAAGLTVLTLGAGLYLALFSSPADYQQGETVRIMYVHVPSAYMAMMIYGAIAVSSFMSLVWKHPLADMIARASAPIGAVFTFLCLLTVEGISSTQLAGHAATASPLRMFTTWVSARSL